MQTVTTRAQTNERMDDVVVSVLCLTNSKYNWTNLVEADKNDDNNNNNKRL